MLSSCCSADLRGLPIIYSRQPASRPPDKLIHVRRFRPTQGSSPVTGSLGRATLPGGVGLISNPRLASALLAERGESTKAFIHVHLRPF